MAAIHRDEVPPDRRVAFLVVNALSARRGVRLLGCIAALALVPFSYAQSLSLHDEIQSVATLVGTTVQMTGRSELHITGRDPDPIPGSQINLDSPEAWLFLRHHRPSIVNSSFLGRVRVNGSSAVHGQNVRVVQHGAGTVVIPHSPDYAALEVFRQPNFQDGPLTFRSNEMVEGLPGGRTPWDNAISSFRLKRGYMVTFADGADGGGFSRVYVAQDGDLEIGTLPGDLDNKIEFVRVIPWRWVSKKGYAGGNENAGAEPDGVRASWFYTWSASHHSSLNIEYVPTQQTSVWPELAESRDKTNVTHYLGFNEPNNPDEHAYDFTPTPQSAVNEWPKLMRSGFRLGSPAPTDGGVGWLEEFVNLADAANLRVDFAVVHFYRCGQTATQLYDFLRDVHLRTGRPIWLKEFNNGANWTTCADPTLEQNAQRIKEWIDMMDATPWVERYSIYSWVEESRQVYINGQLTPMGIVYRDQESPVGYRQEMPAGLGQEAHYTFAGDVRDQSAFGNHAMRIGVPLFTAAPVRDAIAFDGKHDWLQLPPNVGGSQDLTFAAWVRWDGGGNWQRIFDFGDGDTTPGRQTGRYVFLTPRSGAGTLRFGLRIGGGEQLLDAPALTPGEWTHVAVTIGRSDMARLYVNGELVASDAMPGRPSDVSPKFNYIGKSQFRGDPLFAGQVADVRILAQELPAVEIAVLATLPEPGLSFEQWASDQGLQAGLDGLPDDPDRDGIPNGFEYLLDSDPLVAGSGSLPLPRLTSGSELDAEADDAKTYLTLQMRVHRDRKSVQLVPRAADTLKGLAAPGASENVRPVGEPVPEGDFETITYYFTEPVEDAAGGRGFMRLHLDLAEG